MTEVSRAVIQDALEFSVDLMTEMGELVRARSDGGFAVHRKTDGSLVTDVDLLVEREIRGRIRARWRDHSIEGEEDGLETRSSEYRWLVDPIDGTMSFRHGVPLFGTILALTWRSRSVVGVINLPGLDRCYTAGRGLGTHLNGRRLRLADVAVDEIPGELIAVGDRQQFERAGLAGGFDAIMRAHSWVRTYTDCFGHCLAVEGAVGAMWDPSLHAWDFAATAVLVEEAGGKFVAAPAQHSARFNVLLGKPAVVGWILERIRTRFARDP